MLLQLLLENMLLYLLLVLLMVITIIGHVVLRTLMIRWVAIMWLCLLHKSLLKFLLIVDMFSSVAHVKLSGWILFLHLESFKRTWQCPLLPILLHRLVLLPLMFLVFGV